MGCNDSDKAIEPSGSEVELAADILRCIQQRGLGKESNLV